MPALRLATAPSTKPMKVVIAIASTTPSQGSQPRWSPLPSVVTMLPSVKPAIP